MRLESAEEPTVGREHWIGCVRSAFDLNTRAGSARLEQRPIQNKPTYASTHIHLRLRLPALRPRQRMPLLSQRAASHQRSRQLSRPRRQILAFQPMQLRHNLTAPAAQLPRCKFSTDLHSSTARPSLFTSDSATAIDAERPRTSQAGKQWTSGHEIWRVQGLGEGSMELLLEA